MRVLQVYSIVKHGVRPQLKINLTKIPIFLFLADNAYLVFGYVPKSFVENVTYFFSDEYCIYFNLNENFGLQFNEFHVNRCIAKYKCSK